MAGGEMIGARAFEILASEEQWTKNWTICDDHGNHFFDCGPYEYLGQTFCVGDGNDASDNGGDHGERAECEERRQGKFLCERDTKLGKSPKGDEHDDCIGGNGKRAKYDVGSF